jgi:acetoin utilization protein AcuB
MRIDAWMKHPVHVVKPRDSLRHARELMEIHRVNQLPVVVSGRVVGILTDRDLRDAFPSVFESAPGAHHGDANPNEIPVEDAMTANVLMLGPKDTLENAARLMRSERIGALPIVDGHHLVGILARSDVLDAYVALAESAAAPSAGGRSL